MKHLETCTAPAMRPAQTLIAAQYCPNCKAIDVQDVEAFRAAMEWLVKRDTGTPLGLHFDEDHVAVGAPRQWSLVFDIAITPDLADDDDGWRTLTITRAGGHYDVTSDTPIPLRAPRYEGEAVCWHCIVEGNVTEWNRNARTVPCERHAAIEVTCPACQGTGADSTCSTCVGSGTILTDPILWACELLALPVNRAAEKHGDHWLAFLILNAAEARQWDYSAWLECFNGIVMMSQPGGPWDASECPFVPLAQETIIAGITQQLRKEAHLPAPALADEKSALIAAQS